MLIALMIVIGLTGAIEMSGDYVGEGQFDIRIDTPGAVGEASGNGDVAIGHAYSQGDNQTKFFLGMDFDGIGGRLKTGADYDVATHSIATKNLTHLKARTKFSAYNGLSTLYTLEGTGNVRELAYTFGEKGRPLQVLQAKMDGNFSINSSMRT